MAGRSGTGGPEMGANWASMPGLPCRESQVGGEEAGKAVVGLGAAELSSPAPETGQPQPAL